MLDTLRRGANTIVAKVLLGLLTLSFVGWGVGASIGNIHSDTVATVGDATITLGEFQRAYQRQVQGMSRQLGQPVTPDLARTFGVPQRVLGQLMSGATMTAAASELGLGLSDEALAKLIADDASLRAPGATAFDRAYLRQLLQQNGLTEEAFIKERRTQALGAQMSDGLVGSVTTPAAMVEAIYHFQNQVRTVDYLTLARAQVEPIAAPADDVLAKWFEGQKDKFRAPEYRSFSMLSIDPAVLADPSTVADTDVEKEYNRTRAQYVVPEARRIQQILYTDQAAADAASAKLKAGTSFDQLIVDQGAKPEDVDLGLLAKDKVLDPAVGEAAFKLAANTPSEPVKSAFGYVLLRVTEIQPEKSRPLAEVASDIRKALANTAAERTVLETHDEIEDALAGGATLKEVAERFKLTLKTFESDPDGKGADGVALDIPDSSDILKAVFAANEGEQNDPLQAGKGFDWFEVSKITTGRERTLDEVKDKAIADWTDEEAQNRLIAKANEMVSALKAGKAIADLARDASVEVQSAENITRTADDPGLGAAGVAAAFGGAEGTAATVTGLDGTRVVLVVRRVVDPPFIANAGDTVDIQDKMSKELADSLFGEYLGATQDALGTTVDQAMVNAVVGSGAEN